MGEPDVSVRDGLRRKRRWMHGERTFEMLGTWRELVSGQVRCRVSLLNERRGIKYAVSRYETLSECQSQSLNIADKYHITGLEQRPAEPGCAVAYRRIDPYRCCIRCRGYSLGLSRESRMIGSSGRAVAYGRYTRPRNVATLASFSSVTTTSYDAVRRDRCVSSALAVNTPPASTAVK